MSLRGGIELGVPERATSSIDEGAARGEDFRSRAERLLDQARTVDDIAGRTELIIKAAILHHLALLRETERPLPPLKLHETPSFAKSQVDAQILGQSGEKRGLKGGPATLEHARAAYCASEAAAGADPAGADPRRRL